VARNEAFVVEGGVRETAYALRDGWLVCSHRAHEITEVGSELSIATFGINERSNAVAILFPGSPPGDESLAFGLERSQLSQLKHIVEDCKQWSGRRQSQKLHFFGCTREFNRKLNGAGLFGQ